MTTQINRRDFLLSLIALGAGYSLPSAAPAAIVDLVWERAATDPWYFVVDKYGTILVPDYPEAEVWSEVFDIDPARLHTPQDVIDAVDGCPPLASYFQDLAIDEADQLQQTLGEQGIAYRVRHRHMKKVIEAITDDPDFGWQAWIELEGATVLPRFRALITDWLMQPPDYMQSEFFPVNHGCQGRAKAFFEMLDSDTLDALGVVIVEGDHPGSTYYAAELRRDMEDANIVAMRLKLPFRFKSGSAFM